MPKHVSPVVRASFVNLVEPKAPAAEAKPVYSMALMIAKSDPEGKAFLAALKKDAQALCKEKLGTIPKKLKGAIKDGDEEEGRPEWEGFWIVNVKSKSQPGIVDRSLQEVVDPDKLYSGAHYRVSCTPYAWSHATGGKGWSLNLDNVQWHSDGDRFDGRTKAADDFADFAEDAPAEDDDDFDFDAA